MPYIKGQQQLAKQQATDNNSNNGHNKQRHTTEFLGGFPQNKFPFSRFSFFFFWVLVGQNANESGPVGLTALCGGCSQWKSDEKQINNQNQEKQGKAK